MNGSAPEGTEARFWESRRRDRDGVDYWVWKALNCIDPRVLMLEYNLSEVTTASCYTHPAAIKGAEMFEPIRETLEWIRV